MTTPAACRERVLAVCCRVVSMFGLNHEESASVFGSVAVVDGGL
jgi:hypothetical protein